MIYLESFRHFVQEWVEISPPKDLTEWPWQSDSRLFLVNLFPLEDEEITKRPRPLISILINNLEKEQPWIIKDDNCLYREYFSRPSFKLPRKYLYYPFNAGEKNIKTNRYSYTSDTYGKQASYWSTEDMRFIRILAHRQHVRYTVYDSEEYHQVRARLDAMEEKCGGSVSIAENLFDFTDYAEAQYRHSPQLMLIQAPVIGTVKPMRKSKDYRIINGAFIRCDDCVMTIPEEPCHTEYDKLRIPFADLVDAPGQKSLGTINQARAIVYVAVETPSGIFTFQEVMQGQVIETSKEDIYVRVVNHQFTIAPEVTHKKRIEVRLHHTITESLMPKVAETNAFFARRREKLFYRSDMPPGFIKSQGGNYLTVTMPPAT